MGDFLGVYIGQFACYGLVYLIYLILKWKETNFNFKENDNQRYKYNPARTTGESGKAKHNGQDELTPTWMNGGWRELVPVARSSLQKCRKLLQERSHLKHFLETITNTIKHNIRMKLVKEKIAAFK